LQAAIIKAKKSEIIIGMVGAMYILSIIPFLLSGAGLPTITRISLVILPALGVAGLFLFAISRHPRFRRTEVMSEDYIIHRDMKQHQIREMSLLSGAIGGFIATWILIGIILVAVEPALNLPPGAIYSVVGTAIGYSGYTAVILGITLQLFAGVVIGALFGIITTTAFKTFDIEKLPEAVGVGILAGLLIFSVLFIQLTRFGVDPSQLKVLSSIYPLGSDANMLQSKVLNIMSICNYGCPSNVLIGAILLHTVYGAIIGLVTCIISKAYSRSECLQKTVKKESV
jgi:hypothetical protein